jgi:methionyl-tRNA synthetase
MSEQEKFYLTTPIYYVNARPHIGHAYTTIVADVIARRHRLLGDDTFFLTGTDEHGQKVERSAAAAGIPPQQFTDQVSATFRALWDRMGITYNDYIRTTEERHKRGVQKLWKHLEDRGAIYLSTYTGQYSVGEEMFVEGPPGTIGPDGKPTETVTEENYFFRLSDYQRPIIDLIESGELHIQPETVRNEVLSFLRGNVSAAPQSPGAPSKTEPHPGMGGVSGETRPLSTPGPQSPGAPSMTEPHPGMGGNVDPSPATVTTALSAAGTLYIPGALKDLSISRTSFKWGIPVPGNEKHVIYVWLDALANYMTAIGYGSDDPADQAKFEKYWPADLHLVGKEITRFHCVYWPAFLLAAGLPLPKAVVANGWLLFEDSKMSKSRGNIVRTETILDAFGPLLPRPESAEGPGAVLSDEAWKHQQDLFASDVIRYFLLREIPFGQDGSFSFDALVQRYNSDLANGYGNLVSRTLAMIKQYSSTGIVLESRPSGDTIIPPLENDECELPINEPIRRSIAAVIEQSTDSFEQYAFSKAVEQVWGLVAATDAFITSEAPWKLAKNDSIESQTRLRQVLYTAAESIRIITMLAHPALPFATAKVWAQLGLGDIEDAARNGRLTNIQWGGLEPGKTKLGPLSPICPRAPKEIIQLMIDMENPTTSAPSELVDEKTSHPSPAPDDSTHPAAAPRTSTIAEHSPGTHVAASAALTTERHGTPPHQEAQASGVFASTHNSQLTTHNSAPDVAEATPQIAIDDFVKIDLRVAQITVAERIPKADKLLRLEVDLGPDFSPRKRQILSGIAEWYTPEELIGRRIVVIANLAPRKMRGLESHGMLLAASAGENGKPILATFGEDIALGSRLR